MNNEHLAVVCAFANFSFVSISFFFVKTKLNIIANVIKHFSRFILESFYFIITDLVN